MDFLLDFRRDTEERWSVQELDPNVYGFQFVKGTKWNVGLSDREIGRVAQPLLSVLIPPCGGCPILRGTSFVERRVGKLTPAIYCFRA